jgi:tetratricopeptide (TPR) repeat protein
MNRADQGIAECERGLAIDRNHPHAHALIGVGKTLTGRYEETEAHVLEALRISPHDRRAGMWSMIAAVAKLLAGHDKEAVAWLSRSIELDPNNSPLMVGGEILLRISLTIFVGALIATLGDRGRTTGR